ncbi:S8 family serine peptidase [Conexibacter sp. W3-3-2]|uniref:S8 family peptidase n=1 Tax=Conexibacter sp. W3-3-2 TaxID=2675227 RepID=UPI0012B71CBA|nr:S8 family serine peptidase [Conexibacter sp. W3-3-2]MTD47020.1 S8 family serine peptidase [Conexibacter sp. W3-3-2]
MPGPSRQRGGTLTVLALIAMVLGPAPTAIASTATGRVLVALDRPAGSAEGPRATAAAVRALTARAGARATGIAVPHLDTVVVRPPAGVGPAAFAARLRALPGVAHAEAEQRHTPRFVPDDPALVTPEPRASPDTPLQWWVARTGLFAAWDVTRGEGARVAVIDTGVDAAHPDFAGRIIDAVDLDDRGGGDARTDETGHGTHVASMACAAGDDGIGITGAGLGCRMLVYKSDLSDSSIARAIVAAADAGAHAITMSFGTDGRQPAARVLVEALRYAVDQGAVPVAAAADEPVQEQGDPSNVLQPTGTGPDITQGLGLSVTAANFLDERASFAGFGSQISLAAYGAYNVSGGPRGLFGAFPGQTTELERGGLFDAGCSCRATLNGDDRYAYLQGTSMATPIVAAVAALVRDLNPDLSVAEVVRLLKETARRPAGTGWTAELGWGIVDAGAAVTAARRLDRAAPTSRLRRPGRPRDGRLTLRWTSADRAPARLTASGVARVELWRSANGRPARRVASSRTGSARVRVARGSRYAFYTVAVDRAGNREAPPPRPDTRVRVPAREPRR